MGTGVRYKAEVWDKIGGLQNRVINVLALQCSSCQLCSKHLCNRPFQLLLQSIYHNIAVFRVTGKIPGSSIIFLPKNEN